MKIVKILAIGLSVMIPSIGYSYQSYDEKLKQIGDDNPEFAGFYIDDSNNVVISLANGRIYDSTFLDKKNLSKKAVSLKKISNYIDKKLLKDLKKMYGVETFDSELKHPSSKTVERKFYIKPAKYSFGELYDWYGAIKDKVINTKGVIGTDIDEVSNKITILVDDVESFRVEKMKNLFSSFGIPSDAYGLEKRTPILEDATLKDTTGPISGGLQIFRHVSGTRYSICSLGFVANRGSVKGIVTNSHCTAIFGQNDSSVLYQGTPINMSQSRRLGASMVESRYRNGGYISDAVFIPFDIPFSSSTSVLKTAKLNKGSGYPHVLKTGRSRQISSLYNMGSTVGMGVYKTGRTTGTSSGHLVRSCVNVRTTSNRLMKCQNEVSADVRYNYSAGGDSGAAVFGSTTGSSDYWKYIYKYARSANLVGLHWGGSSGSGLGLFGYYSPMNAVIADLGVSDFE